MIELTIYNHLLTVCFIPVSFHISSIVILYLIGDSSYKCSVVLVGGTDSFNCDFY